MDRILVSISFNYAAFCYLQFNGFFFINCHDFVVVFTTNIFQDDFYLNYIRLEVGPTQSKLMPKAMLKIRPFI